MSYFLFFLYRPRRPPASPDASGLPLFPKEHGCGRLLTFTAKTLHHSTLLSSTQTNAKHLNSAKTTQTYPLFSFIFPVFLSVFIHFYLFFHIFLHIQCCRYFCVSFFVFVGAAAGECGRQAGPGRGSGVYGRQIVCTVCVVEEQKQCRGAAPAPRNVAAVIGLPANHTVALQASTCPQNCVLYSFSDCCRQIGMYGRVCTFF
mgnify:CR=1 FL=1